MQTATCTFRLVSSRCRIPHTALPRQSPALEPCLPSATAAVGAAPLADGLFPDTATKEIKKVIMKEKEHPGSLLPLVRFLQTQTSFTHSKQASYLCLNFQCRTIPFSAHMWIKCFQHLLSSPLRENTDNCMITSLCLLFDEVARTRGLRAAETPGFPSQPWL